MNMGKTQDLWFGGELSGQAEDRDSHTVLLSLRAASFFLSFFPLFFV